MTAILDRSKKFGEIYGVDEHGAVYTQGNKKFNGAGKECGPGIAASVPAAAPLEPTETQRAADVDALADKVGVATQPVAPIPEDDVPAVENDAGARESLNAMHPAQIKKMVEAEGLTPASGAGSKNTNIDQLLTALATG